MFFRGSLCFRVSPDVSQTLVNSRNVPNHWNPTFNDDIVYHYLDNHFLQEYKLLPIKEYKKSELYPFKLSKPDHSGGFESIIAAMNLLNEEDKKQHNAEIPIMELSSMSTICLFVGWPESLSKVWQLAYWFSMFSIVKLEEFLSLNIFRNLL